MSAPASCPEAVLASATGVGIFPPFGCCRARGSLRRGVRAYRRTTGGRGLKSALFTAVIIGSGGFLGAIARYGLSGLVQRQFPFSGFPLGTLVVNALGCLLIGVAAGLAETRGVFGPGTRAFAFIGVLGGFTTFSTFSYESVAMLRDAEFIRAAVYVLAHLAAGLALVWLGHAAVVTALG